MEKAVDVIPIFKRCPVLRDKLPYVSLGEFPTPVQKVDRIGADIGASRLYVKRDDLSGRVYGGNKVRKLEFILGDALRVNAREVLTFGFAGSNHCLATAIYARQLGLRSISMLMPQPNAQYVRRNLLVSHSYGAELHLYLNKTFVVLGTIYQLLIHGLRHGRFPQVIPPGGSSSRGVIGFVNAGLELKEQILRGEMPEPDYIYVATGTMGTAAGLMLGLRVADLRSQVVAVPVAHEKSVNAPKMVKLIHETNSLLCSLDPSFPRFEFSEKDIDIRHGFLGRGYALFTEEGMDAVARMERLERIRLEGTYTGKAFAALINVVKGQEKNKDKVLLFWNTYNSKDFSDAMAGTDYHRLPRSFHRYYEEQVQPLDNV